MLWNEWMCAMEHSWARAGKDAHWRCWAVIAVHCFNNTLSNPELAKKIAEGSRREQIHSERQSQCNGNKPTYHCCWKRWNWHGHYRFCLFLFCFLLQTGSHYIGSHSPSWWGLYWIPRNLSLLLETGIKGMHHHFQKWILKDILPMAVQWSIVHWRMMPQTQIVLKSKEHFILKKSNMWWDGRVLVSLIPRWRQTSELL